jgi:hypothetical protein
VSGVDEQVQTGGQRAALEQSLRDFLQRFGQAPEPNLERDQLRRRKAVKTGA